MMPLLKQHTRLEKHNYSSQKILKTARTVIMSIGITILEYRFYLTIKHPSYINFFESQIRKHNRKLLEKVSKNLHSCII